MGNKSKQKDRGYVTATEWREEWGGAKDRSHLPFKRLPFNCCAISFTPWEDPACTADGTVYDITNIVPYVQKFKRHPVSGEPLQLKDVIKLNVHRNVDGEYSCPMLHKVFTDSTHIVAIRPSGNVYCWESVEELNLKPRFMQDLLTDEKFTRKDIIHIQDPMHLEKRNLANFDHIKNERQLEEPEEVAKRQADPAYSLKSMSEDTKRVMAKLGTDDAEAAFRAGGGGLKAATQRMLAEAHAAAKRSGTIREHGDGPDPRLQPPQPLPKEAIFKPGASTWNTDDPKQAHHPPSNGRTKKATKAAEAKPPANDPNAGRKVPRPYDDPANYRETEMRTTGVAARSFTSTAVNLVTRNQKEKVRIERTPKKKGYLRLHTSLGDLNLELHADLAPRTCENFITLAESGYYDNTKFHRSIKNFMIQGGDPTGTGTGGESIYGPTFKDEKDARLLHSGRGVLSMANSGPNTNGSQFFILYKSAPHLNFKHTVFGKVVGGFEVLTAMERVACDADDRPEEDVIIKGVSSFVNPFKEMIEEERKAAAAAKRKAEKEAAPPAADEAPGSWLSNPLMAPPAEQGGAGAGAPSVGKYLKQKRTAPTAPAQAELNAPPPVDQHLPAAAAKKAKTQTGYGNFSAW